MKKTLEYIKISLSGIILGLVPLMLWLFMSFIIGEFYASIFCILIPICIYLGLKKMYHKLEIRHIVITIVITLLITLYGTMIGIPLLLNSVELWDIRLNNLPNIYTNAEKTKEIIIITSLSIAYNIVVHIPIIKLINKKKHKV